MFDVGFSELVVIALVALLVLGPEKLPGAARTVGALVRRARSSWASLQSELEREINATEIKSSLDSVKATPELGALEADLRGAARATEEALRPPAAPSDPPAAPVAPAAPAAPERERHE